MTNEKGKGRAPTLADLRVKLCYICREEEQGDSPSTKRFVHPCNCTLIAHEACLLEWIRTSEGTGRENTARQCPQCKTPYEVESQNPAVLRFLRAVDRNLGGVDLGFYLVGFGFVVRAVYRAQLNYGAWALRSYIGNEVFDLTLTNDTSSWPLVAKANIVMIPASLILARLGIPQPLGAILATWPAFAFAFPRLDDLRVVDTTNNNTPPLPVTASGWPPSPFFFGFVLLPLCRRFYRYYFLRFSRWVMGMPSPAAGRERNANEQGVRPTLLQRLLDNMERAAGDNNADNNNNNNANADDPNRQVISVDMRRAGRLIGGALLAPAIASTMGKFLLRLSQRFGLLRRFLGVRPGWTGIMPPPQLRRYSARELWRRAAQELVEPAPSSAVSFGVHFGGSGMHAETGHGLNVGKALRFVLGAVWGDVRKLDECDPVWWRNALGFGVFVLARDLVQLAHMWLTQREIATRRVRDRDFSRVDLGELDLIASE
ncbi:Translation initiation factor eIF2 gamma subunit [Mycena indigotica]|uniref:Translation initiation factor eIF2 gamma subunit n=1 Tax=Mycena indigotica TaxID=2126181 RepID=A0A8H6W0N3_9AGAR|nr:Translation initiation factor eIF2 gamma subunit [Mycena indigotica]KAF7297258.1 Translation initiation factor eIF2 gamma subunit [Mycena indigotica]